ncbi:MAG: UDP-N-acetylmuramoyl-L-alanyl-D-glutamate--2,6-diaminopimelate ligase [Ilumatobacter sp.]
MSAAPADPVALATIAERVALASGGNVDVIGVPVDVIGAAHDSRRVLPGQLFVCLRGASFDGHDHARAAVDAGAVALLVDHRLTDVDVAQIIVDDTRRAVGPAAASAWGEPATALKMIGITGTNGKTTTAQIVAAGLEGAGVPTGVIGTLHGPRTTPEAPELHQMLAEFVAAGKQAVVMEVSSHALALHRVDGTRFDVVGFTNFGHDHLDLHGSPEAYFRAKSALFTPTFASHAVVNVDDPHGTVLADAVDDVLEVERITVGEVADVVVSTSHHSYRWRDVSVEVPLGGSFNVANSLMALELLRKLDNVDFVAAANGLNSLAPVPGRFELVETAETEQRDIAVVVDYAHTPDGLERLLESARGITSGRVIAVFGCAGRRDREKRPVMGEIAGRLADIAIATSDNPRGEDPLEIIDDVIDGVADNYRSRVTAQPDRRIAISDAVARARAGDTVVIAGKGHETYQDFGSSVVDFDDRAVAREELARQELKDHSS